MLLKKRRRITLGEGPRSRFTLGVSPRAVELHLCAAPGDFYVIEGECLGCGVPESVAPDLITHVEQPYYHCYWKKQPETEPELENAFKIFDNQELGCHRYAGTDPKIQARIGRNSCDYPVVR